MHPSGPLVGLLLSSLLTGCVATTGAEPAAQRQRGDGEAEGIFLVGTVVDTELLPVPEAQITVEPGPFTGATDHAGLFRIGPLEPGEYVVRVEKNGYAGAQQDVVVYADGAAQMVLTITAVAQNVPYAETEIHVTFAYCWVSSFLWGNLPCTKIVDYVAGTNVSSEEKIDFAFFIENPGLVDLLVELDWETQAFGHDGSFLLQSPPGQPLTDLVELYLYLRGSAPLSGWAVVGESNCEDCPIFDATPNKIHFDGIAVPVTGNSTIPEHAVFLNHRMDVLMTYFYNRAGPRDFSAVPDA